MFANDIGRLDAAMAGRPVSDAPFTFLKRVLAEIAATNSATLHDRLTQLALTTRALSNWSTLSTWTETENANDAIRVDRHFLAPIQPTRPYINTNWTLSKRLDVLKRHYRMTSSTMTPLDLTLQDSKELIKLDAILPDLTLVLDRPLWFRFEGECVLNVFLKDIRAVSLAFSVGLEDGVPVAYVGAVQGGSVGPHMMEINKAITHAAHGLRPRDLILNLFRMVCARCGINEMLMVSNASAVAYSPYFGQRAVRVNFDEIAHDHGALPDSSGQYYRMPVNAPRRDLSEVPSKRRSMHKHRYKMLDELEVMMDAALGARLSATPEAA